MSGPDKQDKFHRPGAAPRGGVAIAALVVLILLASGIGFKISWPEPPSRKPTPLRKAFKDFSTDFLGYKWRWVILDPVIEKVAGVDAYLNLAGFRRRDGSSAQIYTSYVGKGTTMVEHEPEVCYVAQGWSLPYGIKKAEIKELQVVIDKKGTIGPLPVNIYLFAKDVNHQMVVNSYCINGRYTNSRTTVRTEADRPGGFYAQTRVVMPMTSVDWTETTPQTLTTSRRFRQAVEILRYVTPLIRHKYLPPAPESPEE
ncbi:MAG: exosortase-associated EpsI family protein [Anaerolineaceae bacterium]|nr:exosortase-associated EpsI family protein [Anaerolineaceae bacterium]